MTIWNAAIFYNCSNRSLPGKENLRISMAAQALDGIGFRSLDFSELALRVETTSGVTLTFDAAPLRAIRTVDDVLDFLQAASAER